MNVVKRRRSSAQFRSNRSTPRHHSSVPNSCNRFAYRAFLCGIGRSALDLLPFRDLISQRQIQIPLMRIVTRSAYNFKKTAGFSLFVVLHPSRTTPPFLSYDDYGDGRLNDRSPSVLRLRRETRYRKSASASASRRTAGRARKTVTRGEKPLFCVAGAPEGNGLPWVKCSTG